MYQSGHREAGRLAGEKEEEELGLLWCHGARCRNRKKVKIEDSRMQTGGAVRQPGVRTFSTFIY